MLSYIKDLYIKLEIIFIRTIYFLRSIKNGFKILLNKNIYNFYMPNIFINNIIVIDPLKIKYRKSIPMKFKRKNAAFIFNFDWDKHSTLMENFEKENYKYISCRELFIDGVKIEKCKEFFYLKNKVEELGEYRGCKNENDINLYFKKLFKLFDSIKKNGLIFRFENNIECMIDKNSNLVKIGGGNHRLAISRILMLKKIPVEVRLIHSNNFGGNIKISELNKFIKGIESNHR